jgi:hypothetical protein
MFLMGEVLDTGDGGTDLLKELCEKCRAFLRDVLEVFFYETGQSIFILLLGSY